MSASDPNQNEMKVPSLFQIAACFEDFFPAAGSNQRALAVSRTPFANLMSHPEQLMAVLRCTNHPNHTATPRNNKLNPAGRAARRATSRKPGVNSWEKQNSHPLPELQKVKFSLEAPAANSVKLAADFTHWEKFPVEMTRSPEGIWFTVVPLALGSYSYRFLVDGEWQEDPRCIRRVPNPFGTANAVRVVE
jgi:hypothetical protein